MFLELIRGGLVLINLFKEIDILAAIEANAALAGIRDILRPCQGAVNIFREALYGGNKACPPHIPFAPSTLGEATRAFDTQLTKKEPTADS